MNPNTFKQIRQITWIGILVNIGLSIVKFVAGLIGNSQAVIADAVHSLSDLATDVAVIWGLKLWSAPPDEEHPYGHRRIEAMITVAIGIVLGGVAVGIGFNALSTIPEKHLRQTAWIAMAGPVLSIVAKEILYQLTVRVGHRTRSSAVLANAWHHRSDALSSIPAIIAVAVSTIKPDWAFIDHVGALVISIFILKVSWDVIMPSVSELIDRGGTQRDYDQIHHAAMQITGVKETHAIRTRRLGSSLHVDLHILVDPQMTVRDGHQVSESVKSALINSRLDIVDVVVHLEPFDEQHTKHQPVD